MIFVGIGLFPPSRALPRLVCTGRGLDEYEYDKSCSIAHKFAMPGQVGTSRQRSHLVEVEVADTENESTVIGHAKYDCEKRFGSSEETGIFA